MRKLLWIGDAGVATGFARCTHKTLEVVSKTWDVTVLGLNYQGDPHPHPYPIYPCWPGGDLFGLGRLPKMIRELQPDLVVVQNDPWNVPEYMGHISKCSDTLPIVANMPVDGKNLKDGAKLNGLACGVFWTEFGLKEARDAGYSGPAAVIPLGIDLELYKPMDRIEAHRQIGLPAKLADAFIVGNINRNQSRKRLDLTIEYFARWVKDFGRDDAYLFLHVAPTGEQGYHCAQLMHYYGFDKGNKRLILNVPDVGQGIPEAMLPAVYSSFDVQVSTTQGEGWGLTTMEGMACGIPQIVPDWAALGEWCEDAAVKVKCDTFAVTPNMVNVVGGCPNREDFILALEDMYQHRAKREEYRQRGLRLVSKPEFDWQHIGERFAAVLEEAPALEERRTA